MNERHIEGVC